MNLPLPEAMDESIHLLGLSFLFCTLGIIITPLLNPSIVISNKIVDVRKLASCQVLGRCLNKHPRGRPKKACCGKVQMSLHLLLHLLS